MQLFRSQPEKWPALEYRESLFALGRPARQSRHHDWVPCFAFKNRNARTGQALKRRRNYRWRPSMVRRSCARDAIVRRRDRLAADSAIVRHLTGSIAAAARQTKRNRLAG